MDIEFLSSEPLKDLVHKFINLEANYNNKRVVALNSIIVEFSTKKLHFIDLLKEMEIYIVSNNEIHRNRSCLLIYEILDRVKNLELSKSEYKSLFEFSLSKMLDVSTILEALKAIHILILKNNNESDSQNDQSKSLISKTGRYIENIFLFEEFFKVLNDKHFHTPAYEQEIRYYVYKILLYLCNICPLFCLDSKEKWISTIANAVEGEKDPRNLILTFKLIDFVLVNFDEKTLEPYLDNIFESVSCYFPITFIPPKNDKFFITQEDLKRGLNSCLGNQKFKNLSLDMIYDKLSATQILTKICCIETLNEIVEVLNNRFIQCKYYNKNRKTMKYNQFRKQAIKYGIELSEYTMMKMMKI